MTSPDQPPEGRTRRPHRTWPQRLLITTNLLVVIACIAVGAGFTFIRAKLADVPVVSVGLSLAPEVSKNEPQNILLIGTDDADRLAATDTVRNGRLKGERLADVIMILRVDPRTKTAALLSIPRDSYVPIEPSGRKSKINAAIAGPNGAANLIETIKSNFGISIQHYVEVDFKGFRDLVEVLQGVPIYLTTPIRDSNTGLLLEKTGCITLDPVQALAYARSRHFEYKKDGKWVSDPTSDLGRISRQQDFIRRAAQRAIDRGIRNPSTALSLINAATQAVTLDNTLSVGDIQQLVSQFRAANVDALQRFQLPTTSGGDASFSYLNVDTAAAEPILDHFRGVDSTQASVHDVIVDVSGGANAVAVANSLRAAGFDVSPSIGVPGAATIRYGLRGGPAAALLARYFATTPNFVLDRTLVGQRLSLTVPADAKVLDQPRDAAEVKQPSATVAPTTTQIGRTPTSTVKGATTTTADPAAQAPATTVPGANNPIGFVPVDDAAAAACTG